LFQPALSSIEFAHLRSAKNRMRSFCVLIAVGLFGAGYWYSQRPIVYAPGVLVPVEPVQHDLPAGTSAIEHGDFHLRPLARFSINARVLHRKVYRYDRQSKLVPVDLALGWGPMSDQAVLDQLSISQSARFYWYSYRQPPPIPQEQIICHSTNVHIIPSSPEIESRCKSLRAGTLVSLNGFLVQATGPEIESWKSSLSRTDTGNGACELMWVEEMSILSDGANDDRQSIARH
jgi:hypothetical protein